MTLSIIGAGFGRTGTLSLKLALEQLGFGPCCHGSDEHHFAQATDFWQRVFNREWIDWDEYFEGYHSMVDSPSCKFYLELAEKYPLAKIILTYREPASWFNSYRDTILPLIASRQGGLHFSFLFGHIPRDRESIIAAYERHNAEVQRLIPQERLLTYEVKQGWQPLCNFLRVPVPSFPFPSSNPRQEFPELLDEMLAKLDRHGP